MLTLKKGPVRKGDPEVFDAQFTLLEHAIPNTFPKRPPSSRPKYSVFSDNLLVGICYDCGRVEFDPRMYLHGLYRFEDYEAFLSAEGLTRERHREKYGNEHDIAVQQHPRCTYSRNFKRILILGPRARSREIFESLSNASIEVVFVDYRLTESEFLRLGEFQLVLSHGYAFRLTANIISKLGCNIINLHPTFLPWGRGIGTIFYAAILDQPTGISIHRIIDSEIDSGPILFRKSISVDENFTTRQAHSMLSKAAESILLEQLPLIASGAATEYPNRPVDSSCPSPYFSRFNFECLVRFFSEGYETKIKKLKDFGYICRGNYSIPLD